jgi:endopeptidase Clp ATP-binding regulatory subunit ClpX
MTSDSPRFPSQDELEKELSDYLSKKYGCRIRVMTPMAAPGLAESQQEPVKDRDGGAHKIHFDMKPEELEAHLDQYVIKQDDAKAVLATKICTHYNRIQYLKRVGRGRQSPQVGRIKNNILLIGPTGVGKTYLVKLIAQKIGVPFVKGDATKFSETGYVGGDVEDLVRDLLVEAGDDVELAEHGIIYLDEVDKIASSQGVLGIDVSRTGVQRALLKPMEETEVDLKVSHDPISQIQALEEYRKTGRREKRTINTRNILFIMSGAFNGLAELVKNRLQKQGIGFGAAVESRTDDCRYLKRVKAEDLIRYGFESEFIGRLPVTTVLEPLSEDDLYTILKNPNNPIINGKKDDFRAYGIDIRFQDDALRRLAAMAYREKTGARGLVSVVERVLIPYEKKLPSTDIRFLVVTEATVADPHGELAVMLANPGDEERARIYMSLLAEERRRVRAQIAQHHQHHLEQRPMVFTTARLDLLVDHHLSSGHPLDHLFEDVAAMYEEITRFETEYHGKHGFRIHFSEDAISTIVEQSLTSGAPAVAICRSVSADYDHGFKLIADRSGQLQFILPREAVVQPDDYLNRLIRETYRRYPLRGSDKAQE